MDFEMTLAGSFDPTYDTGVEHSAMEARDWMGYQHEKEYERSGRSCCRGWGDYIVPNRGWGSTGSGESSRISVGETDHRRDPHRGRWVVGLARGDIREHFSHADLLGIGGVDRCLG